MTLSPSADNGTRDLLIALHVPEDRIEQVTALLHSEGIATARDLRDALELHALPVGHGEPFPGFVAEDFADDCAGVRSKISDLLALQSMFRSHFVEPWHDRDA